MFDYPPPPDDPGRRPGTPLPSDTDVPGQALVSWPLPPRAAPGPRVAAAMEEIVPEALTRDGALAAAIASERQVRAAQAYHYRCLAVLSDRMSEETAAEHAVDRAARNVSQWPVHGEELASAEIALALPLTRRAAVIRIGVARQLAERLPATRAAMERGDLDDNRMRRIEEETSSLTDAEARTVEAAIIERAIGENISGVTKLAKRAVLVGVEQRRAAEAEADFAARWAKLSAKRLRWLRR